MEIQKGFWVGIKKMSFFSKMNKEIGGLFDKDKKTEEQGLAQRGILPFRAASREVYRFTNHENKVTNNHTVCLNMAAQHYSNPMVLPFQIPNTVDHNTAPLPNNIIKPPRPNRLHPLYPKAGSPSGTPPVNDGHSSNYLRTR